MPLGGIGSPEAIPALLATLDSDNECDQLGYSPSFCAAGALDDILGTNETRIKVSDSVRRLPDSDPDIDRLKQLALAFYQNWLARA
jgi:hypothetical protein